MKWLKSPYQKRKNKQIVHSFLSILVNCNINKERFLRDCQPITRLPHSVIALKFSWQFFNQWETKPKSFAPYKLDLRIISALRKLQANTARDSDWFIALFALLWLVGVITIVFDFSTLIWNPCYRGNDGVTFHVKVWPGFQSSNDAMCGLRFLVLYSTPGGFFPQVLRFSSLTKNQRLISPEMKSRASVLG